MMIFVCFLVWFLFFSSSSSLLKKKKEKANPTISEYIILWCYLDVIKYGTVAAQQQEGRQQKKTTTKKSDDERRAAKFLKSLELTVFTIV